MLTVIWDQCGNTQHQHSPELVVGAAVTGPAVVTATEEVVVVVVEEKVEEEELSVPSVQET